MNDLDDDLKLDLTPMIDVIFMLIIFFIMTMSFVMPVINVDLPTSSTANTEAQKTSLVVAISKNGESIICLPHKLVIQIVAKEESELDAITY